MCMTQTATATFRYMQARLGAFPYCGVQQAPIDYILVEGYGRAKHSSLQYNTINYKSKYLYCIGPSFFY